MAGEVGIQPREPAAPISGATITDILQDTDTGRIYAVVEVTGYGYDMDILTEQRWLFMTKFLLDHLL